MMGHFGGGMMGGFAIWGVLIVLLLVALAVGITLLATSLVRHAPKSGDTARADPTPEDILRRRYASGEIDDDEFKRRLAALKSH